MKTKFFLTTALVFISLISFAQGGWTLPNQPNWGNRVDDIFMVNTQIGYAVSGYGEIAKTTDGGDNWITINHDTAIYCRSVEFINTQKGFVGGFPQHAATTNLLRMTTDGGMSWTDLTSLLDPRARKICGLAIPDSNIIYGCGNFFQDSAYIVKSTDGGSTWSFIDMRTYASHLIDMYFLNKDTGFVTGSSPPPSFSGIILYTTDGGQSWTHQYQDTASGPWAWCWKIQHLTDQIYFASLQGTTPSGGRILKSTDGGMTWNIHLTPSPIGGNGIQGVGFLDSLRGWTGGGFNPMYESNDGGTTWDTTSVCPTLNRIFKVNDTLLFASGWQVWKYSASATGIAYPAMQVPQFASVKCHPNPACENLNIDLELLKSTHAMIILLNEAGRRVKIIDNTYKSKGVYKYQLDTQNLPAGIYHVVLMTYEDNEAVKVVVSH